MLLRKRVKDRGWECCIWVGGVGGSSVILLSFSCCTAETLHPRTEPQPLLVPLLMSQRTDQPSKISVFPLQYFSHQRVLIYVCMQNQFSFDLCFCSPTSPLTHHSILPALLWFLAHVGSRTLEVHHQVGTHMPGFQGKLAIVLMLHTVKNALMSPGFLVQNLKHLVKLEKPVCAQEQNMSDNAAMDVTKNTSVVWVIF